MLFLRVLGLSFPFLERRNENAGMALRARKDASPFTVYRKDLTLVLRLFLKPLN